MTDPDKFQEIIARHERQIIVSLAGKIAERRCLRGSGAGWTRCRTPEQLLSFHEAGHLVAAHVLGKRTYFASVTERPDVQVGAHHHIGGVVVCSPIEDESDPFKGRPAPVFDRQTAAREAFVVLALRALRGGERPTWQTLRAYLREARERTAALLEEHWHTVDWFAGELMRHKDLDADKIAQTWANLGHRRAS